MGVEWENMKNIELSAVQRFNLAIIIRSKRYDNETVAEMMFVLLKRIRLSSEMLEGVVIAAPTPDSPGREIVRVDKLSALPLSTLEFENGEVKGLLRRLSEWSKENGLAAEDVEWFMPLKEALESAKE